MIQLFSLSLKSEWKYFVFFSLKLWESAQNVLHTGSCVAVRPALTNLFSSGLTVRRTSTPPTESTRSFRPPSATCWGRSPTSSVGLLLQTFVFTLASYQLLFNDLCWFTVFGKGQNGNLMMSVNLACLTWSVRCLGDEMLLQQTLFDAVVTAPLEAYWNALMLNDRWDLTYFFYISKIKAPFTQNRNTRDVS